ncbi:MAG: UvrD-helicase domain-containing protein [Eubacteriales bacterium]|nr:UvrD-helicase domain-containing protein [Eubacteriales bacterium]
MNLDKLNDKQRKAAMHIDGPLLILAGAGSGKTSTMTHRIAYMIEQGISPYNILAVTFTNKAAGEMRERVESLVGDCSNMWIMTFHAMCLRVLRVHCDVLGYDRNFVIYDGTDQKTIVKNILKELNINDKQLGVPYLLSIISKNKEKEISPEDFKRQVGDDFKGKKIHQVYKIYEERLKKNNAMDFDDLLLNTVRVLQADAMVLEKYRNRFKYIMVDEYQDTNHIQYKLIKMLAKGHENLCVVGDDDQCIYQWRGADIRNILDFEKDFPNALVIKLEQNYRSYGNILKAAHSVIQKNNDRKGKKLWTTKEDGDKIKYYRADNEKDEARYVAQEIDLLKGKNRKYRDFAILYRTNAQSRNFEEGLTRRGIPYRVLSGLRYYDRKEIKDMLSYMRLVINPSDDLSFKRIINEPKRGMGEKTVEKIEALAMVNQQSMLEAISDEMVLASLPSKAYQSVKKMVEVINLCRQEKENLRVSDIYDNLMVKTGYLKALEDANTVEAEGRIENLLEFKSVIFDYEHETQEPTIEEFMEKIALMADVDNHNEDEDAVVLMTMHSAKGLEFPVVFLPGLEDGLFPGNRAFDNPEGMEEERRLCYVGMTRAKETLILTSAAMRTLYGKTDFTRESEFLREIDKGLIDGDAIYERRAKNIGGGGSSLGVSTGTIDGYSNKISYKPFDPLKYSKQQSKSITKSNEDYLNGDRVLHSKFGEGTVINQNDKVIIISFDTAGEKKLAKGIAPIKKI